MANDGYDKWLAEKLWELIPSHHRNEDGLADPPDVLRSIVEVIAAQGAILRRSQDRLWDDQAIELCDDWAIPYIGDLVKTRMISALPERSRRIDVAKTIYYRRRAGTLRVLEELIRDIAEWEGKVVEEFRRLARARHGLDPAPSGLAGKLSGTPPGGFANLRRPVVSELAGGPFDELSHLPDMRKQRGKAGRYGIPKLGFHLYRLVAYRVTGVTPRSMTTASGEPFLTFDPSGRGVPLFVASNRPSSADEWTEWTSAEEWELPGPMRCRLLGHAEYEIDQAVIEALREAPYGWTGADALQPLSGVRFRSETRLLMTLDAMATPPPASLRSAILSLSLVSDCGRAALLSPESGKTASLRIVVLGTALDPQAIAAGDLSSPSAYASLPGKSAVVDPAAGRLVLLGGSGGDATVDYHIGSPGEIGAGTYARSGLATPTSTATGGGPLLALVGGADVVEIGDNATYSPVHDALAVTAFTVQAASGFRPYLVIAEHTFLGVTTRDLTLESSGADATLVLDGLWFGAKGRPQSIVLKGDYESVTLKGCTLDPGGVDAAGNAVHPVTLLVQGQVESLTIQSSIVGRIRTDGSGTIETLTVSDSIVDGHGAIAIELDRSDVHLDRVTVFGGVRVHRLWASEAILTGDTADPGAIHVTDTQTGCFRFGAARKGGRLPHPYESFFFVDAASFFTSLSFGDPSYGALREGAPDAIARGAENGSEMGAFSALLDPIKRDGLMAKVEEFMPFGLIPLFIQET